MASATQREIAPQVERGRSSHFSRRTTDDPSNDMMSSRHLSAAGQFANVILARRAQRAMRGNRGRRPAAIGADAPMGPSSRRPMLNAREQGAVPIEHVDALMQRMRRVLAKHNIDEGEIFDDWKHSTPSADDAVAIPGDASGMPTLETEPETLLEVVTEDTLLAKDVEDILERPLSRRTDAQAKRLVQMFAEMQYFAYLEPRQIFSVCRGLTRVKFPPHSIIFSPGDSSPCMYVVRKGSIKIFGLVARRILTAKQIKDRAARRRFSTHGDNVQPASSEFSVATYGRSVNSRSSSVAAALQRVDEKETHTNTDDAESVRSAAPSDTSHQQQQQSTAGEESSTASSYEFVRWQNKKLRLICTLSHGDGFGERSVLESDSRTSLAMCEEETELLVIDKWCYHRYIRELPERTLGKIRELYDEYSLPNGPPRDRDEDEADAAASADGSAPFMQRQYSFINQTLRDELNDINVHDDIEMPPLRLFSGVDDEDDRPDKKPKKKSKARNRHPRKSLKARTPRPSSSNRESDATRSDVSTGARSTPTTPRDGDDKENENENSMSDFATQLSHSQATFISKSGHSAFITSNSTRHLHSKSDIEKDIEDRYLNPQWFESGLSMPERALKASLFVQDALRGRSLRPHIVRVPWRAAIDRVYNSTLYGWFQFCLVVLHMSLAFWEPPSRRDAFSPSYTRHFYTLIIIEIAVVSVYFLELLWELADLGLFFFLGSRKRITRVLLVIAFSVDIGFAIAFEKAGETTEWLRFSRILRPLMLIMISRHVRRMFNTSIAVFPRLLEIAIILAAMLLFFASIGLFLFKDDRSIYNLKAWQQGGPPFRDCVGQPCEPIAEYNFEIFSNSYGNALVGLFVLLSAANFPEVIWPAYAVHHGYGLFFIVFIVVGMFFVLNLLTAILYDAYRAYQGSLIKADGARERRSIDSAFTVLDVHDAGVLTYDVFRVFAMSLRTSFQEYQVSAMFRLMDVDSDGVIDRDELAEILDAMFVRIERKDGASLIMGPDLDAEEDGIMQVFEVKFSCLEPIVNSGVWRSLYRLIIIVDLAALFLIDSAFQGSEYASDIDALCLLFFVIEIVISITGLGANKYWADPWRRLDIFVTLLHGVGIASAYSDDGGSAPHAPTLEAFRFIALVRVMNIVHVAANLRIFRLTGLSGARMKTLSSTIVRLSMLFTGMAVAVVSLVFYPFAIFGVEFFNGPQAEWGRDRCELSGLITYDPEARFCDVGSAFLTLFQMITSSSWHAVMYGAMKGYGFGTNLYFILFWTIGVLLVLNLFLAVFLDIFMSEREVEDEGQALSDLIEQNAAMDDNASHDIHGAIARDANGDDHDDQQVLIDADEKATESGLSGSRPSSAHSQQTVGSKTSNLRSTIHNPTSSRANHIVVAADDSLERMHRRLMQSYGGRASGRARLLDFSSRGKNQQAGGFRMMRFRF
jgi:CRP-like cAMP-binding protein